MIIRRRDVGESGDLGFSGAGFFSCKQPHTTRTTTKSLRMERPDDGELALQGYYQPVTA